ncbi:tape measure protein [Pseudacidovorax sp. NFM-22]|uniref:tape measure protein n=1 Tax=Pseudacidovorax sp. NFM-22 TaxID=2744469 RepID=UPI001F2C0B2D|nr:tape measure protein [Pseudacidovorax sp. NFM-22]
MADPKIRYDIEAAIGGESDVKRLADLLRNLGATLEGDLKKQAEDAALALESLTGKQDAVTKFVELRRETQRLGADLNAATAEVDRLAADMTRAAQDSERFARAEREAQQAVEEAKAVFDEQKQALKDLRERYTGAARRTDEYREASKQLMVTIKELDRAYGEKSTALKAAEQQADRAATAEKASNSEYQRSVEAARRLSAELGVKNEALARSRATLDSVGISTDQLAATERGLAAAVAEARRGIPALAASLTQTAEATEKAAQAAAAEEAALGSLQDHITRITQAIREEVAERTASLDVERRQLELDKQLVLAQQDNARAQQDVVAADRAALAVADQELRVSRLAVEAKRLEADALQRTADARRTALASVGPLTQAQSRELALSELKAEALRVEAAQMDVAANRRRAAAEEALRAAKAERDAAAAAGAAADQSAAKVNVLSDAVRTLLPLMASAFSAQQFVGLVAESQQLSLSYEAIFGSAKRAAEEMDFVRGMANRLGIESQTLARSYQSLAAATRGTTLEGQQTRAVFEATARAMSMLGKSSVETDRALTAISQMASKGTVSMEELRWQLGEALPGALQATAKGAGITTEQLIGMVENGQVLARDLLPALTVGLNDLYANARPPENLISEWARLKNVIADTAAEVGKSKAADASARVLAGMALGLRGVVGWADVAGTAVGEFAAKVATGNYALGTAADLYARYDSDLNKAAVSAGLAAGSQQSLTTATQAQVRAVDNATDAQTRNVQSTLAVRAAYAETIKGAKQYTELATKVVDAREKEASVLTSLVGIYGTEQERRLASVEATNMQARSLKDKADAMNVEAIILQSYSLKLQEEAQRRGAVDEATKKEIQSAQQAASAKRAEADQAAAVAQAKKIEVGAVEASAAAYADNAAKVYQYRGAAADAAREVDRLVALEKQGRATSEQVAAARVAAAKATALYRDALSDATAAAQRQLDQDRQMAQTTQAAISLDVERANAQREVAEASGNAKEAEAARGAATAAQVRAARESAAAARQEAADIRAVADAQETELRATGQLTAEKKAQLDAQRRSADLKDIEAQKADILAGKLIALANSENARTEALERQISAQEKAVELEERRQALEDKRLGRDKAGFSTDKNGNTVVAGGELTTLTGIAAFLKAAGVADDAAARKIALEFADGRGQIPYFNNPGQKRYGGDTLSVALLRAAERYTFGGAGQQAQQPSTVPQPQSTRSVRLDLNLNGSSMGALNTDEAGAATFQAFIEALKQDKGRAQ